MRRQIVLVTVFLLTACAVHLDLTITRAPSEPDTATLRDEARAILREMGVQAGPLDDVEVSGLLERLRPEQEMARRPLQRLRDRLRRR